MRKALGVVRDISVKRWLSRLLLPLTLVAVATGVVAAPAHAGFVASLGLEDGTRAFGQGGGTGYCLAATIGGSPSVYTVNWQAPANGCDGSVSHVWLEYSAGAGRCAPTNNLLCGDAVTFRPEGNSSYCLSANYSSSVYVTPCTSSTSQVWIISPRLGDASQWILVNWGTSGTSVRVLSSNYMPPTGYPSSDGSAYTTIYNSSTLTQVWLPLFGIG